MFSVHVDVINHLQDMLQNGSVREDPPCRGKVEVISQEEFETHKSRAAASSDDELQFSLDEVEEGSSDAPVQNHSGQPLVKLEPDAKSRFYPVPWKLPVMKDGKVCSIKLYIACLVHSLVSVLTICPNVVSTCYCYGILSLGRDQ